MTKHVQRIQSKGDVISKLRRAEKLQDAAYRLGLVVNDDGSVFDRITKQRFNSVVEWSREAS